MISFLGKFFPIFARPASRRGVRCAAGEEVPLGVQIETALMDAFAPRYVGERARAQPRREREQAEVLA